MAPAPEEVIKTVEPRVVDTDMQRLLLLRMRELALTIGGPGMKVWGGGSTVRVCGLGGGNDTDMQRLLLLRMSGVFTPIKGITR